MLSTFKLYLLIFYSHPILLGGAIAILSLALGLFTQQALTSVPCVFPRSTPNATVLSRRTVPSVETYRIGAGLFEIDWAAKSALQAAVGGTSPDVPIGCPTGNCTFPTVNGIAYSSIGLCNQCVDTTSKISQRDVGVWNYTLPNNASVWSSLESVVIDVKYGQDGFWLGGVPPRMSELDPTLGALNTSSFGFINVLSFTAAGCKIEDFGNGTTSVECQPDTPERPGLGTSQKIVGIGCVLYGCVKSYDARVTNGELVETVVSTVPATGKDQTMGDSVGITLPCIIGGKSYDLANMTLLGPEIPRYVSPQSTTPFHWTACIPWTGPTHPQHRDICPLYSKVEDYTTVVKEQSMACPSPHSIKTGGWLRSTTAALPVTTASPQSSTTSQRHLQTTIACGIRNSKRNTYEVMVRRTGNLKKCMGLFTKRRFAISLIGRG